MSEGPSKPVTEVARRADRLYGELLILLGVLSAAAPFFDRSIVAWALLLAGAAGVWWIALDRTPRGILAGAAWVLITLGLGLHLAFHVILDVLPVGLTLGLGVILLGIAELALGIERDSLRPISRPLLAAGGVAAIAFGVVVPLIWPDIPEWTGGVAVAIMFASFGVALLIGNALVRRPPGLGAA